MSKYGSFYEYVLNMPEPPLKREGQRYYDEMQQLAYNLIKYLKMNDDPNEQQFQGNYNFTYLKENMSEEDFLFLVTKFMMSTKLGDLKRIINNEFTDSSIEFLRDSINKKPNMQVNKNNSGYVMECVNDNNETTYFKCNSSEELLETIIDINKNYSFKEVNIYTKEFSLK